jgi:hypothetical protein
VGADESAAAVLDAYRAEIALSNDLIRSTPIGASQRWRDPRWQERGGDEPERPLGDGEVLRKGHSRGATGSNPSAIAPATWWKDERRYACWFSTLMSRHTRWRMFGS